MVSVVEKTALGRRDQRAACFASLAGRRPVSLSTPHPRHKLTWCWAAVTSGYLPETIARPRLPPSYKQGVFRLGFSRKAEKLPQQSKALDKRFDEEFDIDPKACNVKLRPIRLTPEIDLVLKAPVEHLKEVVKPAKVDGKKGVFVVSEEGYHEVSPK